MGSSCAQFVVGHLMFAHVKSRPDQDPDRTQRHAPVHCSALSANRRVKGRPNTITRRADLPPAQPLKFAPD